jgi:hypothetical protein
MLTLAYKYRSELIDLYKEKIVENRYFFERNSNIIEYDGYIDILSDDKECLQYVSIDNNKKVLGYFEAYKCDNSISNIRILNLEEKTSFIFKKDFKEFLNSLYNNDGLYKLSWFVIIGNKTEKMYDKICLKNEGKIIGIQEKHSLLSDGKYYDVKLYEVFTRKGKLLKKYNLL